MPRFIEGVDWAQASLLPQRLDGYIREDDPVRLIEAFVDELDLEALGFQRAEPLATGRPAYHASTLLPRVRAEMSLQVLTYNMKRIMNLIYFETAWAAAHRFAVAHHFQALGEGCNNGARPRRRMHLAANSGW